MIFPAINLHSSGIFQSLQDDAEEAASSRVQEMMRQKPMEKPWKTMEKPWKTMEKPWKTMEKRINNGIDHYHFVSRILQPSTVTVV